MKNLIHTAVVTLFAASAAHAQQAVQWRVEDGGNGHWYRVVNLAGTGAVDWEVSRVAARSVGGDLATFTSEAETNAFLALTEGQVRGNPWLGLFQDSKAPDFSEPAGGWRWVSSEPITWANWSSNEPNNAGNENWAIMWIDYGPRGTWNDYRPTDPQGPDGYVIEWSADCNNDGVVDYGQILDGSLSDVNADGVPDSCQAPCVPSDLNNDGAVDGSDLGALLSDWGPTAEQGTRADINGDGIVNGADLGILLSFWGACP